jgi:hypothetical protein
MQRRFDHKPYLLPQLRRLTQWSQRDHCYAVAGQMRSVFIGLSEHDSTTKAATLGAANILSLKVSQSRGASLPVSVHKRTAVAATLVGLNRTLPGFVHQRESRSVATCSVRSATLAKLKVARLRGQSPATQNSYRVAFMPTDGRAHINWALSLTGMSACKQTVESPRKAIR